MTKRIWRVRNMVTGGAVVLTSALGTAGVASAATTHSVNTTHLSIKSSTSTHDLSGDPTTLPTKPGETSLTGSTLSSVDAAASASVPAATVIRAESGPNSTYVVHVKKATGSYVTVIENSSFTVTSVRPDLGPGQSGRPGLPGDPSTMAHGPGETPLTGAALTSVVASANAAVPNATVARAETDAQGAAYEVRMKKADGTYETVKEDSSFAVTSIQSGFGTPPVGAPGAPGAPDQRPSSPLN